MLKKELLQLLENIQDDQDVNETILGIEDFAKSSKFDFDSLSIDEFKDLIKTNKTVGGYVQAFEDKRVTDALKTYEEKTLPTKIEEELKKRDNANKTPEQIKLEEQMAQNQKLLNDIKKAKLESKFKDVLAEKKIDTRLLPFVMGEDEDAVTKNIDVIAEIIAAEKATAIKEELKQSTYVPGEATTGNSGKVSWNDVLENPSLMEAYQNQNKI